MFKFIQQQQQKLSSLWSICIFYIISIIFWHWWSISTRNLDSYWYSTQNSYYSRYRCINPPLLSKKKNIFWGYFSLLAPLTTLMRVVCQLLLGLVTQVIPLNLSVGFLENKSSSQFGQLLYSLHFFQAK